MTFWNELTLPYEERQKREREAANKAINEFDFTKIDLSSDNENINLDDWDF